VLVIRVLEEQAAGGKYLLSYDPDAADGRGVATFTDDKSKAMKFKDFVEAWELWRKQSALRPTRPDGKPNRPLTAFTVTFENV